MFQYAYFLFLKNRFGNVRMFMSSNNWEHSGGFELFNVFGIKHRPSIWESMYHRGLLFRKLFSITHKRYQGRNFQVQKTDLNPSDDFSYFYGTWQSEDYFFDKQLIRNSFRFEVLKISYKTHSIAKLLMSGGGDTVSVHVRRRDYLSQQFSTGFGNCCPLDYYKRAINLIRGKFSDPKFVFFSDDMNWVIENLNVEDAIYVNHNHGCDSWQDMYLMSLCDHNIIANSTFSWWGAWLNNNKNKVVIAPKKWWSTMEHDDVVPSSWIRL